MTLKLKQKLIYIFWILFSIIIGILLAIIATKSAGYEKILPPNSDNNSTGQTAIQSTQNQIPGLFYFIKDPNKQPNIKAEAYFVGDLDTGQIILQKNKDQKIPIASISKLMTAVVSTENQDQNKTTKISQRAVDTEGENGDLHVNETIKTSDLIYPMLLESSNDAAEAIAEISGRDTFISQMNEKAKQLGLSSTSFQDSSGLSSENQSTVSDLFKFAQFLKKSESNLLKLTTEKNYNNNKHIWYNTSQFLGFDGYEGGKRGYIDESGQTALSLFSIPLGEIGTRNIGIAVLRSPDRLKDVQNIYNFLKKNIYYGLQADADTAWVKQKEGSVQETETEPNFVNLAFGGDIMLDRGVKNSVMKNFNGDYSAMFENLDILKKADISFANLEGPASDQGIDKHNLYSFRMDPSVIPALNASGLGIVSVANNHEGDWGRDAFSDTLARLNENEIFYTGGGKNSIQAEQPTIIERNGMKIGYLAFSDVGPASLEATTNTPGILLANNPRFDEIIKNASKQVDDLIVSFHFGEEYKTTHTTRQEYLAHKAIDDGAKLIIGSHPHVVEDTETYKNGFIAYSLGNLIFDQYFSPSTMQGMLLEVKLNKDGTMSIKKDTVKLSPVFQPEKVISGKEEKVKYQ